MGNFEHHVRVYYEDTDLGGIVYHSKYLNFCERARSELFFSQGMLPIRGEYHFVVKHIDASFKAPAKFADLLVVETLFLDQRKASFRLQQRIVDEAKERVYFEMVLKLVCLKGDKVAAIPEGILAPLLSP